VIAYADSSALVKLVVAEPESTVLAESLTTYDTIVSSDLAVVEVTRAARAAAGDPGVARAGALLASIGLFRLDRAVLDRAASLPPSGLRSLDAIHVASALELGEPVTVVAYDQRLLLAAAASGLPVASPE
jgi:predicted nucleic acid-binding protein